jgi:hypothetical protein
MMKYIFIFFVFSMALVIESLFYLSCLYAYRIQTLAICMAFYSEVLIREGMASLNAIPRGYSL